MQLETINFVSSCGRGPTRFCDSSC